MSYSHPQRTCNGGDTGRESVGFETGCLQGCGGEYESTGTHNKDSNISDYVVMGDIRVQATHILYSPWKQCAIPLQHGGRVGKGEGRLGMVCTFLEALLRHHEYQVCGAATMGMPYQSCCQVPRDLKKSQSCHRECVGFEVAMTRTSSK